MPPNSLQGACQLPAHFFFLMACLNAPSIQRWAAQRLHALQCPHSTIPEAVKCPKARASGCMHGQSTHTQQAREAPKHTCDTSKQHARALPSMMKHPSVVTPLPAVGCTGTLVQRGRHTRTHTHTPHMARLHTQRRHKHAHAHTCSHTHTLTHDTCAVLQCPCCTHEARANENPGCCSPSVFASLDHIKCRTAALGVETLAHRQISFIHKWVGWPRAGQGLAMTEAFGRSSAVKASRKNGSARCRSKPWGLGDTLHQKTACPVKMPGGIFVSCRVPHLVLDCAHVCHCGETGSSSSPNKNIQAALLEFISRNA